MADSKPVEGAQELQQMLVSYAKQETLEPLKALKKYLASGIAGAVCLFLGAAFISLGVLRLVQGFDTFQGGGFGSLVPYLAALGTLVVWMAIVVVLMMRARKRVK